MGDGRGQAGLAVLVVLVVADQVDVLVALLLDLPLQLGPQLPVAPRVVEQVPELPPGLLVGGVAGPGRRPAGQLLAEVLGGEADELGAVHVPAEVVGVVRRVERLRVLLAEGDDLVLGEVGALRLAGEPRAVHLVAGVGLDGGVLLVALVVARRPRDVEAELAAVELEVLVEVLLDDPVRAVPRVLGRIRAGVHLAVLAGLVAVARPLDVDPDLPGADAAPRRPAVVPRERRRARRAVDVLRLAGRVADTSRARPGQGRLLRLRRHAGRKDSRGALGGRPGGRSRRPAAGLVEGGDERLLLLVRRGVGGQLGRLVGLLIRRPQGGGQHRDGEHDNHREVGDRQPALHRPSVPLRDPHVPPPAAGRAWLTGQILIRLSPGVPRSRRGWSGAGRR